MTVLTAEEFAPLYSALPEVRKARITGVIQNDGPGSGPAETPFTDEEAGPAYEAAGDRAKEVVSRRLALNPETVPQ